MALASSPSRSLGAALQCVQRGDCCQRALGPDRYPLWERRFDDFSDERIVGDDLDGLRNVEERESRVDRSRSHDVTLHGLYDSAPSVLFAWILLDDRPERSPDAKVASRHELRCSTLVRHAVRVEATT
jgi:hypothetical protein